MLVISTIGHDETPCVPLERKKNECDQWFYQLLKTPETNSAVSSLAGSRIRVETQRVEIDTIGLTLLISPFLSPLVNQYPADVRPIDGRLADGSK